MAWLCLMEVQRAHRSVELGYVVFAPPMQRSALATEAFYLIMAHVFDDLGFERLEWDLHRDQSALAPGGRAAGLPVRGRRLRRKLILKGKTQDIPLYALLADEWPASRAAMQRWLSPSNFVEGMQVEAAAREVTRSRAMRGSAKPIARRHANKYEFCRHLYRRGLHNAQFPSRRPYRTACAHRPPRSGAGRLSVTISHVYGETVIPAQPKRIVIWGTNSQDAVLQLGIVPVGIPFFSYGGGDNGILPWDEEAIAALGGEPPTILPNGGELPIEQIAALQPDLILAHFSGITQEEYDTLSQIAPVVAYPKEAWGTSWQDVILIARQGAGQKRGGGKRSLPTACS